MLQDPNVELYVEKMIAPLKLEISRLQNQIDVLNQLIAIQNRPKLLRCSICGCEPSLLYNTIDGKTVCFDCNKNSFLNLQ